MVSSAVSGPLSNNAAPLGRPRQPHSALPHTQHGPACQQPGVPFRCHHRGWIVRKAARPLRRPGDPAVQRLPQAKDAGLHRQDHGRQGPAELHTPGGRRAAEGLQNRVSWSAPKPQVHGSGQGAGGEEGHPDVLPRGGLQGGACKADVSGAGHHHVLHGQEPALHLRGGPGGLAGVCVCRGTGGVRPHGAALCLRGVSGRQPRRH
mmetsp:Transcript_20111/g.50673  ORF Transcript_20111/g.50673 Transcript_20111/m.50673 type:complete len:205 (+) Transcript_20111:747-1361(+)